MLFTGEKTGKENKKKTWMLFTAGLLSLRSRFPTANRCFNSPAPAGGAPANHNNPKHINATATSVKTLACARTMMTRLNVSARFPAKNLIFSAEEEEEDEAEESFPSPCGLPSRGSLVQSGRMRGYNGLCLWFKGANMESWRQRALSSTFARLTFMGPHSVPSIMGGKWPESPFTLLSLTSGIQDIYCNIFYDSRISNSKKNLNIVFFN